MIRSILAPSGPKDIFVQQSINSLKQSSLRSKPGFSAHHKRAKFCEGLAPSCLAEGLKVEAEARGNRFDNGLHSLRGVLSSKPPLHPFPYRIRFQTMEFRFQIGHLTQEFPL